MAKRQPRQGIPTNLSVAQFEQFVLPHMSKGRRGPATKLGWHTIFNYILRLLYLGCQWKELPIEKDRQGHPEIHYTRIYRAFRRWQADGCFDAIFEGSVFRLGQDDRLDISVIHGDGTTTAAKKGGDNLGFSDHKKVKGDEVVVFCDRHCNVIAPFVAARGNRNESPLLREALPQLTRIARAVGLDLRGTIVSLDGVYDCRQNRKAIFNRNINSNSRGRKRPKRGRKPRFDPAIFEERFRTIERLFAWEDKFRRLLLRFERLSQLHYAFKTITYTMINLRHYCRGRFHPRGCV
jgi:transposase